VNNVAIEARSFFWVLQMVCTLHRIPYSADVARRHNVPPYTCASLYQALNTYGLNATSRNIPARQLSKESCPLLVWLKSVSDQALLVPALLLACHDDQVVLLQVDESEPAEMTIGIFAASYAGQCVRILPKTSPLPASACGDLERTNTRFGFAWFIPELLRHRQIWREILLASFVIQLIALATPLFTQTIIDKVIVNRTESTLLAIMAGMCVFTVFSAVLTWLRQYLVLHTGNRVDAVLGATVFAHLLKLPLVYFQHRPTGVIAARMHGVETIRDFIASAAVTLLLDLPFLLIFVAVMLYYSVVLTCIVLGVLLCIVILSLMFAPWFQTKLQAQFARGARNQAFLTEYVAGMETVKSLQLEPQLESRYSTYFAEYLQAGFSAKQLGNTYNTLANMLEQVMSLAILGVGAYIVMHSAAFTIGMLIAFQMFAGKLSQPLLRLVGLWQQFQQARLSVARLGDVMNAPTEPYTQTQFSRGSRQGSVVVDNMSFAYERNRPLYQHLSLHIPAGKMIAVTGASGSGKSTLTRLLQGFYQPDSGRILLDGIDIAQMPANILRSYFGVVPQETVLFAGTIHDNLQMANPHASFDKIVTACQMAEIHHVIEALPNGYHTEIGERGSGLSGGQKQRIAIARALLKAPAILVFDEATSALDVATAQQFARTINKLKGRVTMLFITHAMPESLDVDVVYRLTATGVQSDAMASHGATP
jgi:subfamily B ATP-binding cassette protein HlyB/CyaB